MPIDYYYFTKLPESVVDKIIINLHNIINTSDNYDGSQWSLIDIVHNLEDGYFDIELNKDNQLYIFGVYIGHIDGETKKILINEN